MTANYYLNGHQSQYQPGASSFTRRNGCTWTTGTNGADASTGGDKVITPDYLHSKLRRSEEVQPATPGWHLDDLDLALSRVGVGFQVRTGQGWDDLVYHRSLGMYIALQGDSDRFPDGTCSGAFDGLHCVGVHPVHVAGGLWRYDDPICRVVRTISPAVLRRYAEKLSRSIFFGVFTTPVPIVGKPSEEPMGPQGIPQHPSNAEAKKATKLWTDYNPDTGALSGKSYDIPAGHTKRLILNLDHGRLGIGHDRDATITGKSMLYGNEDDWNVAALP